MIKKHFTLLLTVSLALNGVMAQEEDVVPHSVDGEVLDQNGDSWRGISVQAVSGDEVLAQDTTDRLGNYYITVNKSFSPNQQLTFDISVNDTTRLEDIQFQAFEQQEEVFTIERDVNLSQEQEEREEPPLNRTEELEVRNSTLEEQNQEPTNQSNQQQEQTELPVKPEIILTAALILITAAILIKRKRKKQQTYDFDFE